MWPARICRPTASARCSDGSRNWGCWCSCIPDGFTEARRFKDHYFANVIGNPLDTTVALHHLIFGGVLEDCPGLKLVAAHGGGYLPAYAGRIDHAASARPDTGEKLKEMPGTYLRRLYFDSLVYTHSQLEYLVAQFGADHILVGTDYPADMGETDPVGFIEGAPGLDDATRRAILGGNAARLLGIEVPRRAAVTLRRRRVLDRNCHDAGPRRCQRRAGLPLRDELAVRQQLRQLLRDRVGVRLVIAGQHEAWRPHRRDECRDPRNRRSRVRRGSDRTHPAPAASPRGGPSARRPRPRTAAVEARRHRAHAPDRLRQHRRRRCARGCALSRFRMNDPPMHWP